MEKDITEVTKASEDTEAVMGRRPASRALYAFLEVMAPVAGTVAVIMMMLASGIIHVYDIGIYSAEEIEEIAQYPDCLGEFASAHGQEELTSRLFAFAVIAGLLAVAAVIGLSVMTGRFSRDSEGKIRLNWFDRLWSELHVAACCGSAACAVLTALPVAGIASRDNKFGPVDLSKYFTPLDTDNYVYSISNGTVFWYCAAGIALLLAIAVICWVTLVKKTKAHDLLKGSLTGKILALLGSGAAVAGHGVVKAGKGIAKTGQNIASRNKSAVRRFIIPDDRDRKAERKLIFKYCLIAVALIGLPVFFMIMSGEYEWMLLTAFIAMAFAVVLIIRKVGKLAEIRAGVIEVKSGDLKYKIPVKEDEKGPKTDLDKLAADINQISEATNIAVQNEIKNQRLKTDLISNVSHDLKTPLTSMISYLDILEKEGLDSPDAPAHLAVVKEKTERLRTLTEELFEAAKASSGNIPYEIEDIDVAALIDQSLAELGDRLAKKKLKIKKNIKTEPTIVRADGKLLYRVFENLLSNISKYALDRSRVYIDVTESAGTPGKLLIEFKNISKEELNISPDELMERFTRGDSSRNTEGSGLGLAIAKDLTTLMGGVFEIKIDGDMFKASVMLDRV
ncbi:MAG: sensor histidine kinase [Clostridiales bacterium]|nr:sensor histidine kinase [Clostridiales bacterium]MBR0468657.1 sensor histidine kinase [Mogibacterium sp.]